MEKKKLLLVLGIFIAIISVIGISYAYWRFTITQEDNNLVKSSCLKLTFEGKNTINIEEAFPIIDEEGKSLTPYEFTITNVCDTNASFEVNLEVLEETTFEDLSYIKLLFNDTEPELLTEKQEVEPTIEKVKKAYFLKKGYLAGKESKSYNIRLWMDENTPTEDKYMNKVFSSKIVIVGTTYEKEIDKTPPVANFTTTVVNGGYLVDARTSTDDSSGISTYYYSKDGVNWISSKEDNYVFKDDAILTSGKATDVITSIASNKVYDIYVKVEDNFENMSEVVKKSVKEKELIYDETIDNNLRYVGANPNNYVTFNNELWRIIGVMNHLIDVDGNQETLLKVVRSESIGNYAWDSTGSTNWSISTLKTYLNETYINNINASSNNMIHSVLWHLGGSSNGDVVTSSAFYTMERGTYVVNDTYPLTWNGKIALVYPSDFGFAVGHPTRQTCFNLAVNNCSANNWMVKGKFYFTLTHSHYNRVYHATESGYGVFQCNDNYSARNTFATYPALYLKSNVHITSGTGSSTDPYLLQLSE